MCIDSRKDDDIMTLKLCPELANFKNTYLKDAKNDAKDIEFPVLHIRNCYMLLKINI